MAERRLPLEGVANFRDLGGYRTADGRVTRWGVLYRSDSLAYLTPDDISYLRGIGLRLICDLRTDDERARAPSRAPNGENLLIAQLSIGTGKNGGAVRMPSSLLSPDATGEMATQFIVRSYRRFVLDNARNYGEMFHHILAPDRLPAVVHCTAGKDRTGISSALLLLALGVSPETVVEDYMLTRVYLTKEWRDRIIAILGLDVSRINEEVIDVVFDANPVFLNAALNAIDKRYGSFEIYLKSALHVTHAEQQQLQQLLLE